MVFRQRLMTLSFVLFVALLAGCGDSAPPAPQPVATLGGDPATPAALPPAPEGYRAQMSVDRTQAAPGETLTVSGTGFPPDTILNILLAAPNAPGGQIAAEVETDPAGAFTTPITIPRDGALAQAQTFLFSIAALSSEALPLTLDSIVFQEVTNSAVGGGAATPPTPGARYTPTLQLSVPSVGPGSVVEVIGSGYPANSSVSISIHQPSTSAGAPLTTLTANGLGSFVGSLTIPATWGDGSPISDGSQLQVTAATEDGSASASTNAAFYGSGAASLPLTDLPATPLAGAVASFGDFALPDALTCLTVRSLLAQTLGAPTQLTETSFQNPLDNRFGIACEATARLPAEESRSPGALLTALTSSAAGQGFAVEPAYAGEGPLGSDAALQREGLLCLLEAERLGEGQEMLVRATCAQDMTISALPTATPGRWRPAPAMICDTLQAAMREMLGVGISRDEAPMLNDPANRSAGTGCRLTATGTAAELNREQLGATLQSLLANRGWQAATEFNANSATLSRTGFRQETNLCLLETITAPAYTAYTDCTQADLATCPLPPEEQVVTIALSCATEG